MIKDSKPPTSGRERRCSVRLPVITLVWYKTVESEWSDSGSAIEGVSKMCDISHNGVGLLVTQDLPLGKFVFLEVTGQKFNVSGVGVVVYKTREGKKYWRIGIRFTIIPPNDKIILDRFIQTHDQD
jgi:hypothetical protein